MRKIVILLLAVTCAATAFGGSSAPKTLEERFAFCEAAGNVGASVMRFRDQYPTADAMRRAFLPKEPAHSRQIIDFAIKRAYEYPASTDDSARVLMIDRMRTETRQYCHRLLSSEE